MAQTPMANFYVITTEYRPGQKPVVVCVEGYIRKENALETIEDMNRYITDTSQTFTKDHLETDHKWAKHEDYYGVQDYEDYDDGSAQS